MQKVQIGANAVRAHYLDKGIELSEHEIFEVISRKHTDTINASTAIDLNGKIHEYKEFLEISNIAITHKLKIYIMQDISITKIY